MLMDSTKKSIPVEFSYYKYENAALSMLNIIVCWGLTSLQM